MRLPESAPRQGCPELEALAAFVEGRLEANERTAVIEHLAGCDACREVVAESRALAGELELVAREAAPEVVPFPVRRRLLPGWRFGVAAALVLVGAGLGFFVLLRPPSVEALLGRLVNRGDAVHLPATWTDPTWSVMRGEGPTLSDRAVAFRLGVRSADLALALAMRDQEAVRRLAAENVLLLSGVPFSEPIATTYREIAAKASEPSTNWSELARSAVAAGAEVRDSTDENLVELGRWAETGRLLASSRSSMRAPRPPKAARSTVELAESVAAAEHSTHGGDLVARESAFERLVARGGSLQ